MAEPLLHVVSWNVGLTSSAFYADEQGALKKGWLSRAATLKALVEATRPDVLLLQELGMHEEGFPPEELRQRLQDLLGRHWEYNIVVSGSYAALLGPAVTSHTARLVSICSGEKSWRTVQVVDVQVRDGGGNNWRLVNVHFPSGGKNVTVRADYGRGRVVATRSHTLSEAVKTDCLRAVV
jgi:exonuclease III